MRKYILYIIYIVEILPINRSIYNTQYVKLKYEHNSNLKRCDLSGADDLTLLSTLDTCL